MLSSPTLIVSKTLDETVGKEALSKTNHCWLLAQKASLQLTVEPDPLKTRLLITPALIVRVPPLTLTPSKAVPRSLFVLVFPVSSQRKVELVL